MPSKVSERLKRIKERQSSGEDTYEGYKLQRISKELKIPDSTLLYDIRRSLEKKEAYRSANEEYISALKKADTTIDNVIQKGCKSLTYFPKRNSDIPLVSKEINSIIGKTFKDRGTNVYEILDFDFNNFAIYGFVNTMRDNVKRGAVLKGSELKESMQLFIEKIKQLKTEFQKVRQTYNQLDPSDYNEIEVVPNEKVRIHHLLVTEKVMEELDYRMQGAVDVIDTDSLYMVVKCNPLIDISDNCPTRLGSEVNKLKLDLKTIDTTYSGNPLHCISMGEKFPSGNLFSYLLKDIIEFSEDVYWYNLPFCIQNGYSYRKVLLYLFQLFGFTYLFNKTMENCRSGISKDGSYCGEDLSRILDKYVNKEDSSSIDDIISYLITSPMLEKFKDSLRNVIFSIRHYPFELVDIITSWIRKLDDESLSNTQLKVVMTNLESSINRIFTRMERNYNDLENIANPANQSNSGLGQSFELDFNFALRRIGKSTNRLVKNSGFHTGDMFCFMISYELLKVLDFCFEPALYGNYDSKTKSIDKL